VGQTVGPTVGPAGVSDHWKSVPIRQSTSQTCGSYRSVNENNIRHAAALGAWVAYRGRRVRWCPRQQEDEEVCYRHTVHMMLIICFCCWCRLASETSESDDRQPYRWFHTNVL